MHWHKNPRKSAVLAENDAAIARGNALPGGLSSGAGVSAWGGTVNKGQVIPLFTCARALGRRDRARIIRRSLQQLEQAAQGADLDELALLIGVAALVAGETAAEMESDHPETP
jgi:hypothetical protein